MIPWTRLQDPQCCILAAHLPSAPQNLHPWAKWLPSALQFRLATHTYTHVHACIYHTHTHVLIPHACKHHTHITHPHVFTHHTHMCRPHTGHADGMPMHSPHPHTQAHHTREHHTCRVHTRHPSKGDPVGPSSKVGPALWGDRVPRSPCGVVLSVHLTLGSAPGAPNGPWEKPPCPSPARLVRSRFTTRFCQQGHPSLCRPRGPESLRVSPCPLLERVGLARPHSLLTRGLWGLSAPSLSLEAWSVAQGACPQAGSHL